MPVSKPRPLQWIGKLTPLWLVLAAAGGYFFFFKGNAAEPDGGENAKNEEAKPGLPKADAYFVHVELIEVYPTDEEGDNWDEIGDSGPDLYYKLELHGQDVFRSTTKDDAFIAQWSPVGVEVMDLLSSGRISPDNAIQAVKISLKGEETLVLRIYDEDVAGDDGVATIKLEPAKWKTAEHKLEFKKSSRRAIKRVHVRLFPSTMSASEFLNILGNGAGK